LLHVPEPQSVFFPHMLPLLQVVAQAGAWHVPEHTPDPQSEAAPQVCPSLHVPLAAQPPPVPWHFPLVQRLDAQSAFAPQ
jgi:hypothetical protein